MYKFDILHRLEKQSPTVILCMGIVLQATITTADLATSALFSLSPLYVSPSHSWAGLAPALALTRSPFLQVWRGFTYCSRRIAVIPR